MGSIVIVNLWYCEPHRHSYDDIVLQRMSPPLQIMKSVDVYETCDLPEADQYMYSQSKDDINSVEILQLTPNEAFGRYAVCTTVVLRNLFII